MITNLRLPMDRFETMELKDLKSKNFIFDKNGTGKTTIADEIEKEYSNNYDIRLFKGFQSVVGENNILNSIVLGKENTELQPAIDQTNNELMDIKNELDDSIPGNFFQRYTNSINDLLKVKNVKRFLTHQMRLIILMHIGI